jgi:hypothetical protein
MIIQRKIVKDWEPKFIGRAYERKPRIQSLDYDMEIIQNTLLNWKDPFATRFANSIFKKYLRGV